jgi:hypothetical protein
VIASFVYDDTPPKSPRDGDGLTKAYIYDIYMNILFKIEKQMSNETNMIS